MNNEERKQKAKTERDGLIFTTNFGTKFVVKDYQDYDNVKIEFLDEHHFTKTVSWGNIIKGGIKNPFDKTCFRVACIGYDGEIKNKDAYKIWHALLQRTVDDNYKSKHIAYTDTEICDEWLCYENFENWYNDNYYNIGEQLYLDKDIISKGNKIYSPQNCVFVPRCINNLFTTRRLNRGKNPIGVNKKESDSKYCAKCNEYGKSITLGYFDTVTEAFDIYKIEKERYIKEVADSYKDKIPLKLYNALYDYKIEITD